MKFKTIPLFICIIAALFVVGCGELFEDDQFYDEEDAYYEDADHEDEDEVDDYEGEEIEDNHQEDEEEPEKVEGAENDDNEVIQENASPALMSLPDGFAKQTAVFGIPIIATKRMSDDKVLHVANVMAKYLDNDEDGTPDDPALVETLVKRQAVMMVFYDENEAERIDPEDLPNPDAAQVVFDMDIQPGGAARGEFDATLEEVIHLISFAGLAYTYPDAFGEYEGTLIAEAMDEARGGHFKDIPREYPAGAWYTYDDHTCEYNCMISEYFYWALTSILGGQNFNGRLEQIEHEWQLNTLTKVQEQDPTVFALLTDPQYKLATVLPDGNYEPIQFKIEQ